MNEIELGSSGLRTAPIGFGCSALLGRSGRADSLRALDEAWDEGVRFFDTARSYGYGESEALLGEFLRGRRDRAVIATKFGIVPAPQSPWKQAAKSVARKIVSAAPSARTVLRKGAAAQFTEGQFTIPVLQQSIETSLRKLGTEYVDLLFLHSAPASVLHQEDLLEAMGRLVDQGKVRVAGLSAEPDVVALAVERKVEPLGAMQFPCNLFNLCGVIGFPAQTGGDCVLIANHPFGGVDRVHECREKLQALAASPELDISLRDKLHRLDDPTLADVVLNVILRDTGIHVVIPAMMRIEHIQANVRALKSSRFNSEEIMQIRKMFLAASPRHQSVSAGG